MSFMKTDALRSSHRRRTWALIGPTALLLLANLHCPAQDASCKAVADAELLPARTPHHTYSTETRSGRSVLSEDITMPSGIFWGTAGVWHKSRSSMEELAKDSADKVKELRDCRHVVDEAVNGAPASKYTLHNAASGGDEAVWIGKGSGLALQSEVRLEDRKISSRYEYSNIQAPANVH